MQVTGGSDQCSIEHWSDPGLIQVSDTAKLFSARALRHLLGTSVSPEQTVIVFSAGENLGMARPERMLEYSQRPPVRGLRFIVVWEEMFSNFGLFRSYFFKPLNRTMSLVVLARAMARRLPSRDQAKSTIVRSAKFVS